MFSKNLYKLLFRRLTIIIISALLIVFSIVALLKHEEFERLSMEREKRNNILSSLSVIKAKLEGMLRASLLISDSLHSFVVTTEDIKNKEFSEIAKHFVSVEPKLIRNVGFAKGTVVKYVYPLKGNEKALGLDYKTNKEQWAKVHKAIIEKKTVLDGPLTLVQGGEAIISRTPVYLEKDHFYGLVSIVINIPELYKKAGLDQKMPYKLAIQKIDEYSLEKEVFYGDSTVFKNNPVILDVTVPGSLWQIGAVPYGGWTSLQPEYLYDRIIISVIVVILISSMFFLTGEIERREKTEHDLRKFFLAVENSPSTIVVTDYDGFVEYANPMFTQVTGYTVQEVIGLKTNFLKSGVTPVEQYENLWKTIKNGKIWTGILTNKKKDGVIYIERSKIAPIPDNEGNIQHFVAIKEDITNEERLKQLRDDTERIVQHDLKNPLNGVITNSQYLMGCFENDETTHTILSEIYKSGLRMTYLINNSLNIYKMEEGTYKLIPADFNLIATLKELKLEFIQLTKYKNIKLEFELFDKPMVWSETYFLYAEEIHIRSLLENLISNAIEASPPNHPVTISVGNDESDNHLITLHNFGEIPEEIREDFFNKYVSFGKKNGTGLGTYSAKLIAKIHGGDLKFKSSFSYGTYLILTLPKKHKVK